MELKSTLSFFAQKHLFYYFASPIRISWQFSYLRNERKIPPLRWMHGFYSFMGTGWRNHGQPFHAFPQKFFRKIDHCHYAKHRSKRGWTNWLYCLIQVFRKKCRNRRNCSERAISPFLTVFSTLLEKFLPFSSEVKLSSANCFKLEESKICHSRYLKDYFRYITVASAPIHAFLEFLFHHFSVQYFFQSHWLLYQMTIVDTMVTSLRGTKFVTMTIIKPRNEISRAGSG